MKMVSSVSSTTTKKLVVSFRGERIEFSSETFPVLRVWDVKARLVDTYNNNNTQNDAQPQEQPHQQQQQNEEVDMLPTDIRLMIKGKAVADDDDDIWVLLKRLDNKNSNSKKEYRILATGMSPKEKEKLKQQQQEKQQELLKQNYRIRDDLSDAGRAQEDQRKRLGQYLLHKAASKNITGNVIHTINNSNQYGFQEIRVVPNLADQEQARAILTRLANDPGIHACMVKHQWSVPILGELFPHGNVGESEVCLMGLNTNRGQKIELRIRTDDLKGFRKFASIKQVLCHEMAHNEIGDHNADFFMLMRQIETECNELDWTNGAGLSSTNSQQAPTVLYTAGTYALGTRVDDQLKLDAFGSAANNNDVVTAASPSPPSLSAREMAAQAALARQQQQPTPFRCTCCINSSTSTAAADIDAKQGWNGCNSCVVVKNNNNSNQTNNSQLSSSMTKQKNDDSSSTPNNNSPMDLSSS